MFLQIQSNDQMAIYSVTHTPTDSSCIENDDLESLGAALYKVWTTRDYPNISQGSVCRVEQSIAVSSAHQQILRELLPLDTASSAGLHREARIQETRQYLHGVQFTVSVQRKPDHLPTIQLVPGHSAP